MRVIVSGRGRLLRMPAVIGAIALVVVTASFLLLRGGGKHEDLASAASPTPPTVETSAKVSSDAADTAVAAVLNTLENYGAANDEQAVTIWAEGVVAKNGVTQYSVMSGELKEKYIDVVGDNNGGAMLFDTSMSSIDSWQVSEIVQGDDGTRTAKLRFSMGEEVAAAELTLVDEGEFVVVSTVAVETPLYEFTGIG